MTLRDQGFRFVKRGSPEYAEMFEANGNPARVGLNELLGGVPTEGDMK